MQPVFAAGPLNRDLTAMVSQERFREDLYYRLSVVPIRVPALRHNDPKSTIQEARGKSRGEHILRALEEMKWNVSSAARILGIERTNLHKRIHALRLSREK